MQEHSVVRYKNQRPFEILQRIRAIASLDTAARERADRFVNIVSENWNAPVSDSIACRKTRCRCPIRDNFG
jgi:hypothetical protein